MKVKLNQGIAGERFSFAPHQVIHCSDETGGRYIAEGIGKEVPEATEADGTLHDQPPPEATPRTRENAERATGPKPKTPESAQAGEKCAGKTNAGNACGRKAATGSTFCPAHQNQA
jgi:hypothetical protein